MPILKIILHKIWMKMLGNVNVRASFLCAKQAKENKMLHRSFLKDMSQSLRDEHKNLKKIGGRGEQVRGRDRQQGLGKAAGVGNR